MSSEPGTVHLHFLVGRPKVSRSESPWDSGTGRGVSGGGPRTQSLDLVPNPPPARDTVAHLWSHTLWWYVIRGRPEGL